MTAHTHTEFIEGCYRCDLNLDEGYAGCPQYDAHGACFCSTGVTGNCVLVKGQFDGPSDG